MNIRIKKLANQAKLLTGSPVGEIEYQKFAELLINESIKVMAAHDYHGEWLGEKIKEHFGFT